MDAIIGVLSDIGPTPAIMIGSTLFVWFLGYMSPTKKVEVIEEEIADQVMNYSIPIAKPSEEHNLGYRFEKEYGELNKSVEDVCLEDVEDPRWTNVLQTFIGSDGHEEKILTYGGHHTLIGKLEQFLESADDKMVEDFNKGRKAYLEENYVKASQRIDNTNALRRGSQEVTALRQGYGEMLLEKQPEKLWETQFNTLGKEIDGPVQN